LPVSHIVLSKSIPSINGLLFLFFILSNLKGSVDPLVNRPTYQGIILAGLHYA